MKGRGLVHLSLVIPAYNEANRIGNTLAYAEMYLSKQSYSYEILVVDDGSTDETVSYVRDRFPDVRIIQYGANRGKGYAVKCGMLEATGDYRIFSDADGSTPIQELDSMWVRFDAGMDIIIGSRSLPDSDVRVRQHYIRQSMGRTFNAFVRTLLGITFIDTQCGFKGFTAKSAELVFGRQHLEGFSFDSEILFIAAKHHLRVEDMPVCWTNSPHSRVHIVSDSLRMFRDLLLIRLYDAEGKYR